jgi:hypothetical protein
LLVHREWDDKSQYLARVGFTADCPTELENAIRLLCAETDAVDDGGNDYGNFFRVTGELIGPTGGSLPVVLVWLQWKLDNTFHFVTLKPDKKLS